MEEFVVGSVANLISNKCSKVKLKKKKSKTAKTDEKNCAENDKCLSSSSVNKKISESHNIKENVTVETSGKRKKGTAMEVQTESFISKRKKLLEPASNSSDKSDAPQCKKLKIDLMKLQSCDSKENEVDNAGKLIKENKKLSKKEMSNEDFTENTVFVGNIPISYDRKKISKVFAKFGEVLTTRIRCVPIAEINMNKKVAAIKKQYHPKRNSLVAYVKFKTMDSAKEALKGNGMVVDGHHLRIDTAEQTKERDTSKAVFVGGLPFDIEDDELWEFFKNCGQIESVRVIRDCQTSMGKGFGYVNFDSTASVELALQLDGQELKNRKINVKRCVKCRNKNKSNFFGVMKSKEITKNLCKRGKFKDENKKFKKEKSINFQGRTANMKHKKKKKLSKAALHQRKLVKILGAS